jgi:hypothetical protein
MSFKKAENFPFSWKKKRTKKKFNFIIRKVYYLSKNFENSNNFLIYFISIHLFNVFYGKINMVENFLTIEDRYAVDWIE